MGKELTQEQLDKIPQYNCGLYYENCYFSNSRNNPACSAKPDKCIPFYFLNRKKEGMLDRFCKEHVDRAVEEGATNMTQLTEKDIFYLKVIGKYYRYDR